MSGKAALFSSSASYRAAGLWLARLLVLLGLALAAYAPILRAGFIWDDDDYVENNPNLATVEGLRRIWFEPLSIPQFYPLVHTTYWLEHQVWLKQPWIYHLDNVVLHVLVALLFGAALARLRVPGAWLAAAVFALHPVHVESVAWITERKNVLSGLFYLLAAHAYLSFEGLDRDGPGQRRWGAYATALACFALALLAKTVTCTFPAAMLIIILWRRRRLTFANLLATVPFFALGAALSAVTVWVERHHVGTADMDAFASWTPLTRLLIALRAPWFYLGKLAWPSPLVFFYPQWPLDLPGGPATIIHAVVFPVASLCMGIFLFLTRRVGGGAIVAAAAFFVLTLFPALGFVSVAPMRFSVVADHFQYLASLGPIALACAALASLFQRGAGFPARHSGTTPDAKSGWSTPICRLGLRPDGYSAPRQGTKPSGTALACLAALPLLFSLGTLTRAQVAHYHNRESLYTHVLLHNPDCWIARVNLGMELLGQERYDEAEAQLREAVRLRPDNAQTHNNLGSVLASAGRAPEAEVEYRKAVELNPAFVGARVNLGMALLHENRLPDAITHLEEAVRLNDQSPTALYALGRARAKQGRPADARALYEAALRIDPRLMEPRMALDALNAASGQAARKE